jgi:sulfite exporter TauE/SafE/copper chaperone CopZ
MATISAPATTETSVIPVTGMTCSSCERRITKALMKLPGVETVEVSATRGTASISGTHLPTRDRIDAAIRSAGYEPVAPKWITLDWSIWKTVLLTAVVIVYVIVVSTHSVIGEWAEKLTNPDQAGLALALTLGLTAGVSTCMAMVGGLVLALSASHAAKLAAAGTTLPSFATRMRPHLAFNVGRIAGFGFFGALLGLLGSSLSLPTRAMAVLVLAVAVFMFLLGMRLTGISPRMAAWSPKLPAGIGRALGINSAVEGESNYSDIKAAGLGAATFFLPCGFTQAMQIYALSTASPLMAGLVMATFALGTTPGLLALASVPEFATGKRRDTVLRVVGVVVLAFALFNAQGGMKLLGFGITPARAATNTSASVASNTTGPQTASSNVTVANGVQTVTMTQEAQGYIPADTVVYAGMPIKWNITGNAPYSCSMALRVPDLGVSVNLNQGPNVVDLPALPVGTTPFMCVMGMYTGTLTAIDAPSRTATAGNTAATGTVSAPSGDLAVNATVQGPTAG